MYCCSAVPAGASTTAGQSAAKARRVDIGGYRLYLDCIGAGTPAVIMSAAYVETWSRVQPRVGGFTRACAYDRPGMGLSDAGHLPTTTGQLAGELHRLLSRAGVPGPYILVGEGTDGSAMWLYASRYARSTAGVVLVDAVHPYYFSRSNSELFGMQEIDLKRSREQLMRASLLGNTPLVVMSHGVYLHFSERIERSWPTYEDQLARLSSNSVRVIASHSGYGIPQMQPELVIEAVMQELLAIRGHRSLLPCTSWLYSTRARCITL